MAKVVPLNATKAPPPPKPVGAGEIARAAGSFASIDPYALAIVIGGLVAIIVAAYVIYSRLYSGTVRRVYALTYNPERRRWVPTTLIEVAPGIYTDSSHNKIIFIPTNAPTDTLYLPGLFGQKRLEVYPVVRYGDTYTHVEFASALGLALGESAVPEHVRGVADLVARLYAAGELPAEVKLRPDLSLYVYLDGGKLSNMLVDIYDRTAEESVIAVSHMTGKRAEFEQYVKTMIKLRAKEAESIGNVVVTVAAALGIIFILLAIIGRVAGH